MERVQPKQLFMILAAIFCVTAMLLPLTAVAAETYKFERMWPTLKQPWYFNNPSEIAIDDQGYVYICDRQNYRIQKFTSDGVFIKTWGSPSGSRDFMPKGIAIDSQGYVYVVNDDPNRCIQKFTSDGVFVNVWGSTGSGNGEFLYPYGITTGNQGYVYVVDSGNNRIQKFTADGTFVTKWGKNGGDGSAGSGNGEFDVPTGITTDSHGFVYVLDSYNNRIQKFTADGVFVETWGTGQLDVPYGIAIDSKDYVYVAEYQHYRIKKFTTAGVFVKTLYTWYEFSPRSLAVDASGNVYASDSGMQIQKVTSDGVLVQTWGSYGLGNGEFNVPTGIITDSQGYVYVVDNFNNRIQKFTTDGTFVTKWGRNGGDGSSGLGNGEFNRPYGIAIDSQGYVYVTDGYNNRIQKFTTAGTFVTKWGRNGGDGSAGSGNGEFDAPGGIATDSQGYVYVTEAVNCRIQKFTANGAFVTKWGKNEGDGSCGTGNGEFNLPTGITTDSQGYVYVADTFNDRIQKFTADGTFVTQWGSGAFGNYRLSFPRGIETDSQDYVYVGSQMDHQIKKFKADGDFVQVWGSHGSLVGQLSQPLSLAVGDYGKVYVTDSGNNRIQVFKPVIQAENAKAIIVAGGGPYPGNNLWDATQVSANFAYRALTYQGFMKNDIYYLTANTDLDLDNNGIADDVRAAPTKFTLWQAITQWAVTEQAASLVLYLVDHGGSGTFRLSGTEVLTADELAGWINTLQQNMSGRIIVVYDACDSGSFVPKLQGSNRIIITSTLSGQQAKFLGQGTISFSSFFWTHIFNGLSIKEAFDSASDGIKDMFDNQTPQITGDAAGVYIGNGVPDMLGDSPTIGTAAVTPPVLTDETMAVLSADNVTDPDGIARVWAMIWPPDYMAGSDQTLLYLPEVDLHCSGCDSNTGEGRYEIPYAAFDMAGTYQIAIYAMDRKGNTSLPKLTSVSRSGQNKRKAVIVAGGASLSTPRNIIETNAAMAYHALKSQLYSDNDIEFMSVTGIPGYDYAPSVFYFESYLNSLASDAGTGQLDLVLYFIGAGSAESFQMNETETLTATELDGVLDSLQTQRPGSRVTIIYDGDYSGNFIPLLIPPANEQRIVLSSTCANAPAYFKGQGETSFSAFFWRQVASGASLYDAFAYARSTIQYLSWREEIPFSCYSQQSPLLEADEDGVANEEADYRIARGCTIGMGIRFADDPPQIGAVSAAEDSSSGIVTITAADITCTKAIKRVWAVIKQIGYCPGESGEKAAVLVEKDLTDGDGDGKYEVTFKPQDYGLIACRINVYAMDEDGNTSAPRETGVYQRAGQPDIYEPDNTPEEANVIVVNYGTTGPDGKPIGAPQPHTFHAASDVDWVEFYAVGGEAYTIEAGNLEKNCQPVIELYRDTNLTTPVVPPSEMVIDGKVFLDWECPVGGEGNYYVRLWNKLEYGGGDKTGYSLKVYNGGQAIVDTLVEGIVRSTDNSLIKEATIKFEDKYNPTVYQSRKSNVAGVYYLSLEPSYYRCTVTASGYKEKVEDVDVPEVSDTKSSVEKDFILEPLATTTITTTSTTTTIPTACDIIGVNPSQIRVGFGLLPRIRRITITTNTDLEESGITGRELSFNPSAGIRILGVPKVVGNTIKATVIFWGVAPGTCTLQLGECGTHEIQIVRGF